jgi:ABC-type xylose transport system substrate-binding protein
MGDAGQYASSACEGNYVLIGGSPTDYNAILLRGVDERPKPAIDRGDIKIISKTREGWRATRRCITEDALTRTGRRSMQLSLPMTAPLA